MKCGGVSLRGRVGPKSVNHTLVSEERDRQGFASGVRERASLMKGQG